MKIRNMTARALAVILAFVLVLAPAVQVSAAAETPCSSVEFRMPMNGGELSIKGVVGTEGTLVGLLAAMSAEGSAIDGSIWVKDSALILLSEAMLGKAYGVDLAKAVQNLPKSVFAPDSGSQFALDAETYDQVMTALQQPANVVSSISVDNEAMAQTAQKYGVLILSSLMKNAEMSRGTETVTIGENEITAVVSTYSLNAEAIVDLINTLVDAAAEDEALKEMAAANAQNTGSEVNIDEIWSQLPEKAAELTGEITESNVRCSASVITDKETDAFAGLTVEAGPEDKLVKLTVTHAADTTAAEVLANGESALQMTYVLKENTSEQFNASLSVAVKGETTFEAGFAWDKTTGDYALIAAQNGENSILKGTLTQEPDTIVLTLDTLNDQLLNASVALRGKDTVEAPETFTELLTMSQGELMPLISMVSMLTGAGK